MSKVLAIREVSTPDEAVTASPNALVHLGVVTASFDACCCPRGQRPVRSVRLLQLTGAARREHRLAGRRRSGLPSLKLVGATVKGYVMSAASDGVTHQMTLVASNVDVTIGSSHTIVA